MSLSLFESKIRKRINSQTTTATTKYISYTYSKNMMLYVYTSYTYIQPQKNEADIYVCDVYLGPCYIKFILIK